MLFSSKNPNPERADSGVASVSAGGLHGQRKYAILFAETIIAARKLNEIGSKPCPARECAIADAISNAELILKSIDARWPVETVSEPRW